ncbi:hypothetical protein Aperf_G00000108375 [Anoplocephala perfoliata]
MGEATHHLQPMTVKNAYVWAVALMVSTTNGRDTFILTTPSQIIIFFQLLMRRQGMTFFRFTGKNSCLSDDEIMSAHNLTPNQLEDLRDIFNCFDLDGNGTISKEEFAQILSVCNLDPSSAQIKLLMSQVDINGDGQIAFDEFVECFGAKELTSAPDVATLQETFRVFDKDNDGYITSAELQAVLKQMGLTVTVASLPLLLVSLISTAAPSAESSLSLMSLHQPPLRADGSPPYAWRTSLAFPKIPASRQPNISVPQSAFSANLSL